MLKKTKTVVWLLWILALSACSGDPQTGPVDVRWDRDICDRCRMVLSDPHFAVQVRYFPEGKRSKVARFDDIGCAVIWLQGTEWEQDSNTEIWVADHETAQWINARTATYVNKKTSPMEYALGATSNGQVDGMSFEQAKAHIAEIEERFNVHGLQLKQRFEEQALQRAQNNQEQSQ